MLETSLRHWVRWSLVAALLLGSSAASAESGVSSDLPTPARAQAQYEQGVEAYRHKRYRKAIHLFLSADELVPSPALTFNAARAYEKLGEPARALEYYREYLRRGADTSNADQVQKRVQELEAILAEQGIQQLTVRTQPTGATLHVDGSPRGTTPWTGELELGSHHLLVTHEGHEARQISVRLGGDEALDLEVALAPAAEWDAQTQTLTGHEPPARSPAVERGPATDAADAQSSAAPWPWVVLGAGGVALGAAGVFELLRRDAEHDARAEPFQPAYYDHHDKMQSHQTTARVLFGVGAVLVIGGGVWAWLDQPSGGTERSPVAVGCHASGCAGTWRGSF